MFRPKEAEQMTTPMKLQHRVSTSSKGAEKVEFVDADNSVFMCSFKTFGGTEVVKDGVLVIVSTAKVTMWYRDDLKASDRMILLQDGSVWKIIGDPEDIEMRNQFWSVKLQKVKGG